MYLWPHQVWDIFHGLLPHRNPISSPGLIHPSWPKYPPLFLIYILKKWCHFKNAKSALTLRSSQAMVIEHSISITHQLHSIFSCWLAIRVSLQQHRFDIRMNGYRENNNERRPCRKIPCCRLSMRSKRIWQSEPRPVDVNHDDLVFCHWWELKGPRSDGHRLYRDRSPGEQSLDKKG